MTIFEIQETFFDKILYRQDNFSNLYMHSYMFGMDGPRCVDQSKSWWFFKHLTIIAARRGPIFKRLAVRRRFSHRIRAVRSKPDLPAVGSRTPEARDRVSDGQGKDRNRTGPDPLGRGAWSIHRIRFDRVLHCTSRLAASKGNGRYRQIICIYAGN